MRQKHLESALSSLRREFVEPDVTLEQYPTSPHLAAAVVLTALERHDLGPGRTALDLGCGTGMLTVASALVETDHVLALDCDPSALAIAIENVIDMEVDDQVSFILAKVKGLPQAKSHEPVHNLRGGRKGRGRRGGGRSGRGSTQEVREYILSDDDGVPLLTNSVDTVLTNPPFGTKNNAGMDLRFLRAATRLARRAVYSFHKTSTREFLLRKIHEWGMEGEVVAQMEFDLPSTYRFHKEKNVDVKVDLIRVQVTSEDKEIDTFYPSNDDSPALQRSESGDDSQNV